MRQNMLDIRAPMRRAAAVGHWPRSCLGASLLLAATLAAGSAVSQGPAGPAAIYTAAQASAGAALYGAQCAVCHGADLTGGEGPALKGDAFKDLATIQKLTPASLHKVIVDTMPKGAPRSLTAEQYAQVTAYILQQNGYAAGTAPFTAAAACADCAAPLRFGPVRTATADPGDHGVPQAQPGAPAAAPAQPPVPELILAQAAKGRLDVTDAQLLAADSDRDNWLLHGRTYDNMRFSPLTQITKANVRKLRPVSIIQTGVIASFEATPIVVDGVMYIAAANNNVQAYDAVSGRALWRYTPKLNFSNLCCGPQTRGVAVAYGKVFVAQLDGRVAALDARDGKLLWRTDTADTLPPDPTFYSFTGAPQVYNGMVIVGSSGAEYPTRGFVQAYDQATGKLIWRFHTTAAPDEPGGESWAGDSWKYGGGSVWNTPAIDVKQDLVIFATGNPNADYDPTDRKGDNLYTVSIVAIHAKTGKIAWWHQMVPHDQWDYDAAAPVLLFDVYDAQGNLVPVAGEASKEGHLFMVDRRNGKLVRKSEAFVLESPNKFTPLSTTPVTIYPGVNGGNNWSPPAYSPLTKYFYVPATNQAWTYTTEDIPLYTPGTPVTGQRVGGTARSESDPSKPGVIPVTGSLSAIDVNTGKIAWQYKSELPMAGGALATASNLVFHGESTGDLNAFDAKTGEKLWTFHLGAGVSAPPITYRVNGVQYVAVGAGGLAAGGLSRAALNKGLQPNGDVVAIFALPD
jgi:PQQ-dependent dehydrogenase (methanol/ethanol family)